MGFGTVTTVAVFGCAAFAAAFGATAAAATAVALRLLERGDAAGLEFGVAQRDEPTLLQFLAIWRRRRHRLTFPILAFTVAAVLDLRAHIHVLVFADNDVIATRIERVAGFD